MSSSTNKTSNNSLTSIDQNYTSKFQQRLVASIKKKAGTRAKSLLKPISKIQNALRGWKGIGKLIGLWLIAHNLPSAKEAMKKLKNALSLKNITAKATQFIHSMGDMISKTAKNAVNNLQKTVKNTIQSIGNQIQNTINNITTSIQNMATTIEQGFSNIATMVTNDFTKQTTETGGLGIGNALAMISLGYSVIETAKNMSSTISTSTLGTTKSTTITSGESKLKSYALTIDDSDDEQTKAAKQKILDAYKKINKSSSESATKTVEELEMEAREKATKYMLNKKTAIEAQVANLMYKQDDMSKLNSIITGMKNTYLIYTTYYGNANTPEERAKKRLIDIEDSSRIIVTQCFNANDSVANIPEEERTYDCNIPLVSELKLTRDRLAEAYAKFLTYDPKEVTIEVSDTSKGNSESSSGSSTSIDQTIISTPMTNKPITFEQFMIQNYTVKKDIPDLEDTEYEIVAKQNIKGLNYTDCYKAPEATVQIVPDAVNKKLGYIVYSVQELAWKCIRDYKNNRNIDNEEIEAMETRYVTALRYLQNTKYKMEVEIYEMKKALKEIKEAESALNKTSGSNS